MAAQDTETAAAPAPCAPCRGSGRVTAGLGGTPHAIPCPWCDGTGVTIAGRHAQDHAGAGDPAAGGSAGSAPTA